MMLYLLPACTARPEGMSRNLSTTTLNFLLNAALSMFFGRACSPIQPNKLSDQYTLELIQSTATCPTPEEVPMCA